MTDVELLTWARGTGLQIAGTIFIIGMLLRLFEVLLLGRKRDFSEARGSAIMGGLRTSITRNLPRHGTWHRLAAGYVFHIGLLIIILFFVPHILVFRDAFGIHWSGLPNPVIDAVTIISIAALLYSLALRMTDPVRRFLSGFGDYFALIVTLLPVVTGYLAFHRELLPYTEMLAIHILSVELLLVIIPFSKLTHMASFALSRWYNGSMAGRKGIKV